MRSVVNGTRQTTGNWNPTADDTVRSISWQKIDVMGEQPPRKSGVVERLKPITWFPKNKYFHLRYLSRQTQSSREMPPSTPRGRTTQYTARAAKPTTHFSSAASFRVFN